MSSELCINDLPTFRTEFRGRMAACAANLSRIRMHVCRVRYRDSRFCAIESVCAWSGTVVDRGVVVRGAPPAMELREMSRAYGTAEETAELLPQRDSASEYESYFIEYAMQKEMINRNRCPASRRLLSQAAQLDFNFSNSNHSKVGPRRENRGCPRLSFAPESLMIPEEPIRAGNRGVPCTSSKDLTRISRFTNDP